MASSERIKTYGGDIVDDASATTAGDDDTDNISTTIMGTQEQDDDHEKASAAGKISPPPAATTTSSYNYNSFHNSDEAAGYNTALKSPPTTTPTAETTPTKAVSRGASTEFEELLSSTIISLLEKIIPRWDIPKRLELLHSLSSSRYRSLEFADSNHYKTTGLDNHNNDDGYDLLDYIESQHVSIDDDDDVQFQSLDNTAPPPLLFDQGRTPKANNLKTTGLELEFDNALDTTTAATLKAHDTTNRHNRQSRHHSRRQHSNSPTEYLPQSAAIILQALQQCCNNSTTTNNNNLENGSSYQKVEDILSFILQNSGSGGIGNSLVGGEGELIDEDAGGGRNNVDAANDDEGSASILQQPPPPAATMNQDGDNSFESSNNNNHHHHDNDNYDYYDDDDSLKGDMARLSQSVAHLQRDLDNIDTSRFDWMYYYNNDDEDGGGGGTTTTTTEQQDYLLDDARGDGRDIIGNRWKCWIRNWLLSHGIIKDEKDEKVVNSLLLPYGDNDDDDDATRRGRGGLTIFDYEMDHVFVVTLLLVFFVLLRNRFKTINDLLLFDEEDSDNDSGGMWQIFDTYGWGYF